MTINFQYVQMPNSEAMNELMTSKLNKLAKKFDFIIRADVFFKMENDPSGNGKICEIRLSVPGPRIFAKTDADDFEKAAAATIKDLESQLQKRKHTFKKY
jgi:putative sigma-54 modulation protein